MVNKALILDWDGSIIKDVGYIKKEQDVVLIKKMIEPIRTFQQHGFLIIVITNQSGIGRGWIRYEEYEAVNRKMCALLEKEGIKIDDIFMCPALPNSNHPDRKPNPGMILKAIKKHGIDKTKSIMVGDKEKDVLAGKRAGLGFSVDIKRFLSDWQTILNAVEKEGESKR